MRLINYFDRGADLHPRRDCLHDGTRGWTYGAVRPLTHRIANGLRSVGLESGDKVAVYSPNHAMAYACLLGIQRAGLVWAPVNARNAIEENLYILDNTDVAFLFYHSSFETYLARIREACPKIRTFICIDRPEFEAWMDRQGETAPDLAEAPEDVAILISSGGTTGRPKGILRPLPEDPPANHLPIFSFLLKLWKYRDGMIYLSPAPLYHSAPQAAVGLTIRSGGTAVIMEKFDPEAYLALVPKYRITHSQLVPTMFSRMLKLPEAARKKHDLSSLEIAIHAAAPCPVQVKEQMIQWWGPIIDEYYGATEGLGFTACNSTEWLAHKGTVGKVLLGKLHVPDDAWNSSRSARRAPCGSRPRRRSSTSTIPARRRKRARPTAA